MRSWSERIWTLHDGQGAFAEVAPSPRYVANEIVSLREAATAALGVACLAASLCSPLIESGAPVRILPGTGRRVACRRLLMPHRRRQLPSVRVVVDHLIAELSLSLKVPFAAGSEAEYA